MQSSLLVLSHNTWNWKKTSIEYNKRCCRVGILLCLVLNRKHKPNLLRGMFDQQVLPHNALHQGNAAVEAALNWKVTNFKFRVPGAALLEKALNSGFIKLTKVNKFLSEENQENNMLEKAFVEANTG